MDDPSRCRTRSAATNCLWSLSLLLLLPMMTMMSSGWDAVCECLTCREHMMILLLLLLLMLQLMSIEYRRVGSRLWPGFCDEEIIQF